MITSSAYLTESFQIQDCDAEAMIIQLLGRIPNHNNEILL